MIELRSARAADIEYYARIQAVAWGEKMAAESEKLRNRFAVNPDGVLVAEQEGNILGLVSTIRIVSYDYARSPSWYEISSDGWCHNHQPDGTVLYGIDLSVLRGAPRGTVDILMVGVGQLAIRSGLKYCMLGGRMPRYYKHHQDFTPGEYMQAKTKTGRYLDPEIEMYSKVPGLKIIQLLPNYFDDWESLDYGVLLRWRNPFYGLPGRKLWAHLFPKLYELEQKYQRRRAHKEATKRLSSRKGG
ncbi:MAG TPA: hypothetical protein VLF41_01015 [Candidatus Nanoarchaeia archaeon]|nr:hypothetical protein [Candidatus Nanoarchaeia archaeon]